MVFEKPCQQTATLYYSELRVLRPNIYNGDRWVRLVPCRSISSSSSIKAGKLHWRNRIDSKLRLKGDIRIAIWGVNSKVQLESRDADHQENLHFKLESLNMIL